MTEHAEGAKRQQGDSPSQEEMQRIAEALRERIRERFAQALDRTQPASGSPEQGVDSDDGIFDS